MTSRLYITVNIGPKSLPICKRSMNVKAFQIEAAFWLLSLGDLFWSSPAQCSLLGRLPKPAHSSGTSSCVPFTPCSAKGKQFTSAEISKWQVAGSLSSILSLCRAWFLFSLVSDPREPTAVGYSRINSTKGKSSRRQRAAAQRDSVTDGIIATIMSDQEQTTSSPCLGVPFYRMRMITILHFVSTLSNLEFIPYGNGEC